MTVRVRERRGALRRRIRRVEIAADEQRVYATSFRQGNDGSSVKESDCWRRRCGGRGGKR